MKVRREQCARALQRSARQPAATARGYGSDGEPLPDYSTLPLLRSAAQSAARGVTPILLRDSAVLLSMKRAVAGCEVCHEAYPSMPARGVERALKRWHIQRGDRQARKVGWRTTCCVARL